MSVNITVNGKFTKHTKYPILDDPERTRKELEHKRRTLRLQQVREQSKELARKIRNDVSQEKERQLRNLEAVKTQELNCWRENVLAQKCHDYQLAKLQVGQAHQAAKTENEAKKLTSLNYNAITSKLTQKPKALGKSLPEKQQKPTTRLERIRIFDQKRNKRFSSPIKDAKKKCVHVCFDENTQHCSCTTVTDSDDNDDDTDEKSDIDFINSSVSSMSSLEFLDKTEAKATQTETKTTQDAKSTAIAQQDVGVETEQRHIEVADKLVEVNLTKNKPIKSPKKATTSTQTYKTLSPEVPEKHTFPISSTTSFEDTTTAVVRPRYTQISDLIEKQKKQQAEIENPISPPSPKRCVIIEDKSTTASSTTVNKKSSPVRSPRSITITASSTTVNKKSSPVRSPRSITSRLLMAPKTSAATILTHGASERIMSGSDSSAKVQYYDYRNKYTKEYVLPTTSVVPENNQDIPNAMQQASLEKNLQKKREEELEKLRQKSDERGQHALEREQIRRDCIELTEKLEALTQQRQNLLPSDANLHNHQYYSTKNSRKEAKMNTAIEELLSRPAIITCDDVRNKKLKTSNKIEGACKCPVHPISDDLNLGAQRFRRLSDPTALSGSDSCGSILLGYIDDQRDHIQNEITQCETNPATSEGKVEKLQKLMERIDTLRKSLLKEIDKNNTAGEKVDKATQARKASIDNANKQAKSDETVKEKRQTKEKPLKEKKKSTQVEVLKKQTDIPPASSTTEIRIVADKNQVIEKPQPQPGKPLEIVIKVKSEKRSSKKSLNFRTNQQPMQTAERRKTTEKNLPPAQTSEETTNAGGVTKRNRSNSYDSNSTAYRSLPPVFTNASEQFVNRVSKSKPTEKQQTFEPESPQTIQTSSDVSTTPTHIEAHSSRPPRKHLNPLIAQYIQRLLAMSRQSVMALDVSSSEIDTPSSSIVNITANMPNVNNESSLLSEDHIQRVERFIHENRNFLHELEESFRMHSNSSMETSMRFLEEAWKQKFRNVEKKKTKEALQQQNSALNLDKLEKKQSNEKKINKISAPDTTNATETIASKRLKATNASKQVKTATTTKQVSHQHKNDDGLFVHSQSELKHYAELTKNCSTRIAELTALITKVREEKQRLLEVTLTSVSDNERPSTEYRDLPVIKDAEAQAEAETVSGGSIRSQIELTEQLQTAQEVDNIENSLEKHKTTGRSRDSGISMASRPVTAMGNEPEIEPESFVSSIQTTATYTTSSIQRKTRPPPAISTQNRYSPLVADEEVVHELSTIVEVDTPATSRLNASLTAPTTQQDTEQRQQPKKQVQLAKEPLRFPTFEEYVHENNLDLTTLDQEQSLLIEREYNDLIEAIKDGKGHKVYYDEFPTLTTYLQNLSTNEESIHSPETFDELFEFLRHVSIAPKPFPSHREYIEQRKTNSPENEFIDTESLENITTTGGGASAFIESESDTIDIEGELKRRNILKGSFRSLSTRQEAISLSSSPRMKKRAQSKISAHSTAFELAGIERLNSSETDSASEKFQQELMALGLQWPQTMRKKEKQLAALSSSTSDTTKSKANDTSKKVTKSAKKHNKSSADHPSDSESSDRPLNLRDFLTRQLLKHAAATSSCESSLSGDSLRSQFFLAVLDSMTPSGTPRTNTASHNAIERQKTSTPVPSPNGVSVSKAFSNESHLSSVHPKEQDKPPTRSRQSDNSQLKDENN